MALSNALAWGLAAAAILIGAGILGLWLRGRRERAWRRFARRQGLCFERGPAGPRVHGELGERALELRLIHAGSDGQGLGVVSSRMSLALRAPTPAGVEVLDADGAFGQVQRALEPERIELGDELFERRAVVRGGDADAARRWLVPERRAALIAAIEGSEGGLVGLSDGRIYVDDRELVADPRRLEARLGLLQAAARRLDEPAGEDGLR